MMEKTSRLILTAAVLILITARTVLADSIFSNYDFTFYSTVSQSLAIMDSSNIGFDYTGFGFIGTRNTNGLFVRIGVQLPYKTIVNLFEPAAGSGTDTVTDPGQGSVDMDSTGGGESDIDLVTDSGAGLLENEYTLTLILGPAFRYVVSPTLDFYAGIGPKLEEHITTSNNTLLSLGSTTYDTLLALDFDAGVKFNLEHNTSCRIGVYGTCELLSYSYESSSDPESGESFSTSGMHINIIASGEARTPLSLVGYVSMGKTFNSEVRSNIYRYETTSPLPNRGTTSIIGQE